MLGTHVPQCSYQGRMWCCVFSLSLSLSHWMQTWKWSTSLDECQEQVPFTRLHAANIARDENMGNKKKKTLTELKTKKRLGLIQSQRRVRRNTSWRAGCSRDSGKPVWSGAHATWLHRLNLPFILTMTWQIRRVCFIVMSPTIARQFSVFFAKINCCTQRRCIQGMISHESRIGCRSSVWLDAWFLTQFDFWPKSTSAWWVCVCLPTVCLRFH